MSHCLPARPEFVCPKCRGSLVVVTSSEALSCDACGSSFPLVRDIRRFVSSSGYSESFGFQWNQFRCTQLDSHSGLPISHARLFDASGWNDRLEGELILEAGSGAGRFTEVLAQTGARVCSFDLSSAVEANYSNNGHRANVEIVQASIFEIPFTPGTFDKVVCLGVLQHTPDPERAFDSLAKMVRPGGWLVIDVYARHLRALLSWKYILRPVTRRMDPQRLFRIVSVVAPKLVPVSKFMRSIAGAPGARLVPILEYSHMGLPDDLNRSWAVLDTFDMFSPAFDSPRSIVEVQAWFAKAGFDEVTVKSGFNGVIGRGRRPPAGS